MFIVQLMGNLFYRSASTKINSKSSAPLGCSLPANAVTWVYLCRTQTHTELRDFNYSSSLTVMLVLEGRFHPLDHPSLTEPVWTRWEWLLPERKQHRTAYAEILVQGLQHSYRTQWVCVGESERALAKILLWRLLIRLDKCGGGLMQYQTGV